MGDLLLLLSLLSLSKFIQFFHIEYYSFKFLFILLPEVCLYSHFLKCVILSLWALIHHFFWVALRNLSAFAAAKALPSANSSFFVILLLLTTGKSCSETIVINK